MLRRRSLVVVIACAVAALFMPGTAEAVTLDGAEWQATGTNSCQFEIWYAESGGNLHPGTMTAGAGQYCAYATTQELWLYIVDGEGDVLAAKGTEGLPGGFTPLGLGPVGVGLPVWSGSQYLDPGQGTVTELTVQLPAPTAGHVYTVYAAAEDASNCEEGPCTSPPPPPVQPHAGTEQKPFGFACWSFHPSPQMDTHCDQQLTVVGKGT
ncbi:MAG TPA: hypothetical protein VH274_05195 [Mycobacteriales bacterium]|jgi:hypothetical protein|nr:hypothetical protein [Mycobacteriales bacterium]